MVKTAQENLLAVAEKMAQTIAQNAPIAVRNCKKAINEGLQTDMDHAIVIEEKLFGGCFETEDQKAGMGNFLEKDKDYKLYDEENRVVSTMKGEDLYKDHYDQVEAAVRERYEKIQKQAATTQQKTKTVTSSHRRR